MKMPVPELRHAKRIQVYLQDDDYARLISRARGARRRPAEFARDVLVAAVRASQAEFGVMPSFNNTHITSKAS